MQRNLLLTVRDWLMSAVIARNHGGKSVCIIMRHCRSGRLDDRWLMYENFTGIEISKHLITAVNK